MKEKVTGKKVLSDCVVLATDLGIFVFDLGKRLYFALKKLITEKDSESVDKREAQKSKSDSNGTAASDVKSPVPARALNAAPLE